MHDLTRANRGEVPITLISKDNSIRQYSFDSGRHGRCPSMRCFDKISVEIVIGEHRATDRRHTDRLIDQTHLLQNFGDQPMRYPMSTTRAIMRGSIGEAFGSFVNQIIGSCCDHLLPHSYHALVPTVAWVVPDR